eukprot:gnl/TRDRNA2_/TRDRNA2_179621_c0_seq1.p1 gnl/TRDRNA2_/TRDRNA2_179621_c0~~gnl/TRDRNA2_/TRDRNA2_179621_c0_seq1.p1  ORF type:complete len:230 (-),score=50.04 gnl/TRDRNA2_/TRDRNA2_179621_c0_seq1:47-736(-)
MKPAKADCDTLSLKAKLMPTPIFLENPDGTITEAIPPNYHQPKSSRRDRRRETSGSDNADSDNSLGLSDASAAANASMYQEVDFLYSRHERVLMLLLGVQFMLEVLYNVVFIVRMDISVVTIVALYGWHIQPKVASGIFWGIFVLQASYSCAYYCIAAYAMWSKRPRMYRMFANWSIVGIATLVLLAYVDEFNLLIFFMRLLAYIYARFLQGLTASLMLLPPTPAAAGP